MSDWRGSTSEHRMIEPTNDFPFFIELLVELDWGGDQDQYNYMVRSGDSLCLSIGDFEMSMSGASRSMEDAKSKADEISSWFPEVFLSALRRRIGSDEEFEERMRHRRVAYVHSPQAVREIGLHHIGTYGDPTGGV